MSSAQTKDSSRNTSIYVTNRTALDTSGRLKSLYDGYRDGVLGSLNISNQGKFYESQDTSRCEIIHGNKDQNQNILKLIGIDDESRLSTILKLRGKDGIAAIVDYSNPINEYTRLFCYTYVNRVEKLPDDAKDIQQIINCSTPQTKATHIITGVEWGISIVVVLQLPSASDTITEIDRVLHRLCIFLLCDYNTFPLNPDEKNILKKIIHSKIYSNTPDIKSEATLYEVCTYIEQNKNSTVDHPVSYILRPITWLYPQYIGEGATFVPLTTELNHRVEEYVLQITNDMKRLKVSVTEDVPKLLSGHLREQLAKAQQQSLHVQDKCTKEIERFSKLVFQVRSDRIKMSKIDEALKDDEQMTIKNTIRNLTQILNDLAEKGHFISDLDRQSFRYVNVADHGIDRTDTERTIERKLTMNDQHDRILCSKDLLNKNNPKQLEQLRRDLTKEFKNNSNLHLIYADFSYSSFELHHMMTFPSTKHNNEKNKSAQKETSSSKEIQHSVVPSTIAQTSISTSIKVESSVSSSTETQISVPTLTKVEFALPAVATKAQPNTPVSTKIQTTDPSSIKTHVPVPLSSSLSTVETINILLLGETGVGKSTFINALANYLMFGSLQQAQLGKLVVLIPVSFLITVGHNFEEHIVKFSDPHSPHNEDFSHPGQSVTQRCKSYDFRLNHNNGKKLRIIDTPGFGDTRGLDQDDLNMRHILEYIKNLSHLNAVCFLLKPNESRLNIFFRSCLIQLFSLLGQNIGNNIIFCFTNSRATFYTPGNTAPLLKKILASLPMDNVQFKKDNTFCFDSESFRYLVALRNGISFSDLEKEEYEMSWTKSVTASNRLIHYIFEKLPAHRMHGE